MTKHKVTFNGENPPGVQLPKISTGPAQSVNTGINDAIPASSSAAALPLLLSVRDTIHELGICKTTIYQMINERTLERVRIGRRTFITSSSVLAVARPGSAE